MSTMFADTLLIVFISVCTALLAEGEPGGAAASSRQRGQGRRCGPCPHRRLLTVNPSPSSAELRGKALGTGNCSLREGGREAAGG